MMMTARRTEPRRHLRYHPATQPCERPCYVGTATSLGWSAEWPDEFVYRGRTFRLMQCIYEGYTRLVSASYTSGSHWFEVYNR